MASDAREKLRSAFKDTSGAIGRLVPSLFIMCMSAVILGGSDDRVLLTSGKVSTPLVGQTRYEIFMVLAPLTIVGLRLYIDMQIAYLERVMRIVTRFRVHRPIGLSAVSNPLLFFVGAIAVHIVPPGSIAFLGRHVSAIYPIYGLFLYGVATALVLWSAWSLMRGRAFRRAALNFGGIAATAGFAALIVGDSLSRAGVFGERDFCEKRYEGFAEAETAPFLRKIKLDRLDFAGLSATNRNLTCGSMNDSNWSEADLRATLLWGADLTGATFTDSDLASTEFFDATLRRAQMDGAHAMSSLFQKADLNSARFDDAFLEEANFNSAEVDGASFIGASLRYANMTRSKGVEILFNEADLSQAKLHFVEFHDVNFRQARLRRADFYAAEIVDADFAKADLREVSFYCATLENVDFSETAIEDLAGIEYAPLSAVEVLWPEGFEPDVVTPKKCKER